MRGIDATGVAATVILVRVRNGDEARRLSFVGSPTVRVDGDDVEPAAAVGNDFEMQCRLYRVNGRLEGAPPADWIAAALLGDPPESQALTVGAITPGKVDR